MRIVFATLFLLCVSSFQPAHAQVLPIYKGQVIVSESNGAWVSDAFVRAIYSCESGRSLQASAMTDIFGRYQISVLPSIPGGSSGGCTPVKIVFTVFKDGYDFVQKPEQSPGVIDFLGTSWVTRKPVRRGSISDFETRELVPGVAVTATTTCDDGRGNVRSVSARTMTDASGRYEIQAPPQPQGFACSIQTISFTGEKEGYDLVQRAGNQDELDFVAVNKNITRWKSVSAAKYSDDATREMIRAAFGVGLADRTEAAREIPLPNTLAGRSVVVTDFSGLPLNTELLYVSPEQVNFVMPSGAVSGPAIVALYGDSIVPLQVDFVNIRKLQPGFFSANADGKGVAAGYIVRVKRDGSQSNEPIARYDEGEKKYVPVPIDVPTDPDERIYLILFGTGWREIDSISLILASLYFAERNTRYLLLSSWIGYAGKHPTLRGLDQMNIELPFSRLDQGLGELEIEIGIIDNLSNHPVQANRVKIFVK